MADIGSYRTGNRMDWQDRDVTMRAARPALSEILRSEGFDAMAQGAETETDHDRLHRLARIAVRNAGGKAHDVAQRLRFLGFNV